MLSRGLFLASLALFTVGVEGREAEAQPSPVQAVEVHQVSAKAEPTAGNAEIAEMGLVEYLSAAVPEARYGRISQDLQYTTFAEEVLTLPMRRPRTVNAIMATTKTWLADLVVQCVEIRSGAKAEVDKKRSFAFALFGFLYVGLFQWVLYVSFMAWVAPGAIVFSNEPMSLKLHDWHGQEDLLKQVLVDNLFLNAFCYFPAFYMLKEFVSQGCSSASSLLDGLRRYRGNFASDNAMSMVFWFPGDFLAFAAPMYMRLPLDHAVSFIWTMVLSYRRGGTGTPAADAAAVAKKVDDDPKSAA